MSTQSTVCIIITIVLYLLFMLYLGFRFTNANQSVRRLLFWAAENWAPWSPP